MATLPYTARPRDAEPPAPPSFVTRTLQVVQEPTRVQRLRAAASRRWVAVKNVAPTLAGFGAFSAAAFQLGTVPGLVVTGLSILAAEWKVKG